MTILLYLHQTSLTENTWLCQTFKGILLCKLVLKAKVNRVPLTTYDMIFCERNVITDSLHFSFCPRK